MHPRVICVPETHPYVQAALPADVADLAGTTPPRTRQWGPDPALDPEWISAHADAVDIVHVHFGFEHKSPDALTQWVSCLQAQGIALVVTVHDLRNPHHSDAGLHAQQLRVLIMAANTVVTLTEGAASTIRAAYGISPVVIPHPPLLPLRWPAKRTARVGLTLKDRPSTGNPVSLVRGIHTGIDFVASQRPEARAVIEAHDRFLPRCGPDAKRLVWRSDESLIEHLSSLEVVVLPYRFGSHSGWLEACRDRGVRVVAPSCGFYAEQWSEVITYGHDESGLDEGSLARAVAAALLAPPFPDERALRTATLHDARVRHARLYESLIPVPA